MAYASLDRFFGKMESGGYDPGVAERSHAGSPRTFAAAMRIMRWFLDGRAFEMRGVAANERVRLGTAEEWEFINPGGPMAMAHPIHLHGSQFRIIERQASAGRACVARGRLRRGLAGHASAPAQ